MTTPNELGDESRQAALLERKIFRTCISQKSRRVVATDSVRGC